MDQYVVLTSLFSLLALSSPQVNFPYPLSYPRIFYLQLKVHMLVFSGLISNFYFLFYLLSLLYFYFSIFASAPLWLIMQHYSPCPLVSLSSPQANFPSTWSSPIIVLPQLTACILVFSPSSLS